jgi:triosephosphate isomerase
MIIAGNWKAYVESKAKAKALVTAAKNVAGRPGVEIILAPPAPYLGLLAVGNRTKVQFAAQDVSETTGGAQTGEITAAALSELGVTYAIIGHSERRARGETDAVIAEKLQHAFAQGITPILCIGERERDPEARYLSFLRTQISTAFTPLTAKQRLSVIIAYEPIWAIGKTAAEAITPTDLTEMILYIRKALGDFVPGKSASRVAILYGGSIEATNARALASGTGIDGFLVGHASADPKTFTALVKSVS